MSWFSLHLDTSLALIERAGNVQTSAIIDIGGGASTLADDLLDRGCRDLTVLDISDEAMQASIARIGERSKTIRWIRADITEAKLPARAYDLWHDRALFHFLTTIESRHAYVNAMLRSVKPDGQIVMGVFGPDGPRKCSGLDIIRYDASSLAAELGPSFHCLESLLETHGTPAGATQQFLFCRFAFAPDRSQAAK